MISELDFYNAITRDVYFDATKPAKACFALSEKMAIDFAQWASGHFWSYAIERELWLNQLTFESKTTSELFQQFKQNGK